jgi:hypothetical protein
MAELARPPVRRVDQSAGAFDIAQMPGRQRKAAHRYAAGVSAEAFPCLVIMRRVAGVNRSLAMSTRPGEISSIIADQGEATARNADFYDTSCIFGFPQGCRRELARRPHFASQERQSPLTMGRREALRKLIGPRCKLSSAREDGLGVTAAKPLDHITA